jgi:NADPH:quinone reductase
MRHTMAEVFGLLTAGKVTAAIDTTFSLERAGDALQYVKDGNARGKVVLTTGTGRST